MRDPASEPPSGRPADSSSPGAKHLLQDDPKQLGSRSLSPMSHVQSREMSQTSLTSTSRPKSRTWRYKRRVNTEPRLDYDPLSGIPLQHLTFLFKHAPFTNPSISDKLSLDTEEIEKKLQCLPNVGVSCYGNIPEGLALPSLWSPERNCEFSKRPKGDIELMLILTNRSVGEREMPTSSSAGNLDDIRSETEMVGHTDISDQDLGRDTTGNVYERPTSPTSKCNTKESEVSETSKQHCKPSDPKISTNQEFKDDTCVSGPITGNVFAYLEIAQRPGHVILRRSDIGAYMSQDLADYMTLIKARMSEKIKATSFDDLFKMVRYFGSRTPTSAMDRGPIDVIPSLPCPQCPRFARSWFQRQRPHEWPFEKDIATAKRVGCHVVQAPPHDSYHSGSSWRLSFSMAERILARSLSETQRKAYLLMNLLNVLNPCRTPAVMESYWLKTVLFWSCEQTAREFWREDNLGPCVLYLLDRLLHSLTEGQLTDFFLDDYNLLADADQKALVVLSEHVAWIRKNPCTTLERCYAGVKFGSDATYRDLFEAVINFVNQPQSNSTREKPMECLIVSAYHVGQSYLADGNEQKAAELFDEGSQLLLEYSNVDDNTMQMLRLTAFMCVRTEQLDKAIDYFEAVCSIAEEHSFAHIDLSICLCNLATLYHSKYYRTTDAKMRQLCLERCEENFECSIAEDFSLASVLHYSIFLLKWNRSNEVVEKLNSALALTDEREEKELLADMTGFLAIEADTLDSDLCREVKTLGALELPTVVVAYYVLSKALIMRGYKKRTNDSVFMLELLCECEGNTAIHTSWALLGYIKKALHDHRGALRAFKLALRHKNDYDTAREQIRECTLKLKPNVSACCTIL